MVAPKPLTLAQALVLRYLHVFVAGHGYPPTLREIMIAFRWGSTNAASDYIAALKRKGWVDRDAKVARGIRLLTTSDDLLAELSRIEEAA